MDKQFYMISGLPRSGSTLLSAILNQNPDFHAGVKSDLLPLLKNTTMNVSVSENRLSFDHQRRENVLKAICEGYYKHTDAKVVFDSERSWTGNVALAKKLFPKTKIIACVRDINSIINSFEALRNKNPYYAYTIAGEGASTALARADVYMNNPITNNNGGGHILMPLFFLNDGLSAYPDMIHLVEYEDLCKNPEQTMRSIYDAIDQPYFNHDFDNVEYSNTEFDLNLGQPDLHTVRRKVEYRPTQWVIPKEIRDKYEHMQFWRQR